MLTCTELPCWSSCLMNAQSTPPSTCHTPYSTTFAVEWRPFAFHKPSSEVCGAYQCPSVGSWLEMAWYLMGASRTRIPCYLCRFLRSTRSCTLYGGNSLPPVHSWMMRTRPIGSLVSWAQHYSRSQQAATVAMRTTSASRTHPHSATCWWSLILRPSSRTQKLT